MGDDDRRGTTVVVASAGESARELLGRIVESAGHTVVRLSELTPEDAPGAMSSAAATAVVVDLGRGTLPVLRALAAHDVGRQVRVIAVTEGPGGAESAREAGAHVALARPFPATSLLAALTPVTEGDATMPAEATASTPAPAEEPGAAPEPPHEPVGDPLLDLRRRV